jgi:FtsH-binding integral membrane protein
MISVLIAILVGLLLGRVASQKVLKFNDTAFTILSTVFVFLMGISLGLSRTIFVQAQSLLISTLLAAFIFSLGSIFSVMLLTKFIIKSDV